MSVVLSLPSSKELPQPYACIELRVESVPELPAGFCPYILTTTNEQLLFQLAALNPRYLDVPSHFPKELFIELKRTFPNVGLIASYHNYEHSRDDLEQIYSRLRALPCDLIKIVTFAESSLDGLKVLSFLQKHAHLFPLAAFCMGEKGSFTRILQPIYGGCLTYGCLEGNPTAEGQLTVDELYGTYHVHKLSRASKPFALIGDPLTKSPSHRVHNERFRDRGIDAVYVKITLQQEEFEQAIPFFEELSFQGISVTMPLKYAFSGDEPVNTALFQDEGQERLLFNTDGEAALDLLGDVQGRELHVHGAGATGHAIAKEALKRGARVTLSNRTPEKAERLAERLGCRVGSSSDLVVNATSNDSPFECSLDVRLDTESGRKMWERQAEKQFELWIQTRHRVLPPSKSQTLRAILFGALADGVSLIENLLPSPDTRSMIEACRALGADIQEGRDGSVRIHGIGTRRELTKTRVDAGNSGIVLRFISAVSALFSEKLTIIGDDSMAVRRSCSPLLSGLEQLGATVSSHAGHTPIEIQGPLSQGTCEIDGRDSQPVSALLIAAALLPGTSEIIVRNAGEKPWVALTVDWLRRQDVQIEEHEPSRFIVHGRAAFQPFHYKVPGDLSSLSYLLVGALITPSQLMIHDVDVGDLQADRKIISILEEMGAQFDIDADQRRLSIKGPQQLHGIAIDVNDCIDMVTILAVAGCYAEGTTHIYNAEVARDKESDRLHAITTELRKMGASIEERQDGLLVKKSQLKGCKLDCHQDHRIAMALHVASLGAQGETVLVGAECVQKSYPNFLKDVQR